MPTKFMFGGVSFLSQDVHLSSGRHNGHPVVRIFFKVEDPDHPGMNAPEVIATLRRMEAPGNTADSALLEVFDDRWRRNFVHFLRLKATTPCEMISAGQKCSCHAFFGPDPSLVFVPAFIAIHPLWFHIYTPTPKGS